MPPLDASAVAKLLIEFGHRTALRGGNPYRSRAYYRAAESLLALAAPLQDIIRQDRLREIPGVGDAIADIISKLHETGTHPGLERMRKEVPAGLLELLNIPGLRPDKVLKIHRELGISSLDELERSAREDRLKNIKGLGAALQRKILEGIEIKRGARGQRHLHRAAELLSAAEHNLRGSGLELDRITAAGEFRRGCELISNLSLVAETMQLEGPPDILRLSEHLTIHLTDKNRYGVTLLFATGSSKHLEELQTIANEKGLVLEPDALRRGDEIVAAATEEDIYGALGMPFIEPELREGRGELRRAIAGKLPVLVTDRDLRGILHAHTDASDGVHRLEQMAEATRERGYGYFGIADHSRSAGYAGGLSIEEIEAQHALIDRLNAGYAGKFRIFKGIESDILPDGALDYPDPVLARFDFVVASVHSRFALDREAQTARIVRAAANPYTTILGHMTGRQLLRRPGYDLDVERVLAACAEYGVAVEINGNPWRLDLDWRWHAKALELGCMMSINPDAHSMSELDLAHWGVKMARKGGVPKERVLNCLGLREIAAFFETRRSRNIPASTSEPPRARARAASRRSRPRRVPSPKRAASRSTRATLKAKQR
jgi:DNA polymerase (family 10)